MSYQNKEGRDCIKTNGSIALPTLQIVFWLICNSNGRLTEASLWLDSWLKYLPCPSGQNCEGDDEPGHSIIDNKTLSSLHVD